MREYTSDEGIRKHRPKKKFRFEYIEGKFSGLTKEDRKWRAFAEMEKEEDGYKETLERLKQYQDEKKLSLKK